mgnify:CR=1 FL=1
MLKYLKEFLMVVGMGLALFAWLFFWFGVVFGPIIGIAVWADANQVNDVIAGGMMVVSYFIIYSSLRHFEILDLGLDSRR